MATCFLIVNFTPTIRADTTTPCMFFQVCGDATILFPLLISQTFARHWLPIEPPVKKPQEKAAEDGFLKATYD